MDRSSQKMDFTCVKNHAYHVTYYQHNIKLTHIFMMYATSYQ